MTTTRVLKKRGATVTLAAYGEVLFVPGQDIDQFVTRLKNRIRKGVSAAAPGHNYEKRPLRPHQGIPLKRTITTTATKVNPRSMRVDAAVGSRAAHALFVDQGTGIYNSEGGGPYEAKVLPPWRQGEGSLYEATWTPGKRQVRPVIIKGQKAQRFMEKGLDKGFLSMMRRGSQIASEPKIGRAMALFPETLMLRGAGATPVDAAFKKNLAEWRRWRDEAFWRGDQLGRGQVAGRKRATYLENLAKYRASVQASNTRAAQQVQSLAISNVRSQTGIERKRRRDEALFEAARQDKVASLNRRSSEFGKRMARTYDVVRRRTLFNAAHTEIVGYLIYAVVNGQEVPLQTFR